MADITLVQALAAVANSVLEIAAASRTAAEMLKEARDEQNAYNAELQRTEQIETRSEMSKAPGSGASGMSSSSGTGSGGSTMPRAVTVPGLAAAMQITRGRG